MRPLLEAPSQVNQPFPALETISQMCGDHFLAPLPCSEAETCNAPNIASQQSNTQVSMQPCQQVCPAGTPVKEEHTSAVDLLPSCNPELQARHGAQAQP